MKKKILVLVLATVCITSGCGRNMASSGKTEANSQSVEGTTEENAVESKVEKVNEKTTEEISEEEIDVSKIQMKSLDSCFIADNTAYEYYGYKESYAIQYADLVKSAASIAGDKTQVFSVLIPTSIDVTLPSALRKNLTGTSNQSEAIKFIYDRIGDSAKTVWILDNLKKHKSEYLYFRTDHHWTALGAYYAYQEFAKAKGVKANSLDSFKKMEFNNFLGSFYQNTGEAQLGATPDVITAYIPMGTNEMTYTDKNGNVVNWNIIKDVSDWKPATKYNTFISGDNPYVKIENPNITDGSSCLVIKESLGNAMVPFLVDHYQTVNVIDYRYYKGTLSQFICTTPVDDIIFLNYMSAAISSTNMTNMSKFIK